MYTFIRDINIHVCQPFVNLICLLIMSDWQNAPFLGDTPFFYRQPDENKDESNYGMHLSKNVIAEESVTHARLLLPFFNICQARACVCVRAGGGGLSRYGMGPVHNQSQELYIEMSLKTNTNNEMRANWIEHSRVFFFSSNILFLFQ